MNNPDTDGAANLSKIVSAESVNKLQLQRSWIKLVRQLSTAENTRYARVFNSTQWSNYNVFICTVHGKFIQAICFVTGFLARPM